MPDPIKSYKSPIIIDPNNAHDVEKLDFLRETFVYLSNGTKCFMHVFLSLLGGMNETLAKKIVSLETPKKEKKKKSNKPSHKIELFLAICWFRLVKISKNESSVLPALLGNRFEKYFGAKATPEVMEYFSANYDEATYAWKDMREEFVSLKSKLKVSEKDLISDIGSMINERYIGLKFGKPWGIISGLFGEGKKVDRSLKVELLKNVLEEIEKNPPKTKDQLAKMILKCADCKNGQEIHAKCGKIGRMSSVSNWADEVGSEKEIVLSFVKSKISQDLAKQSNERNWKCVNALKSYILSEIGNCFDQSSWSEMLNNSLSVIQSKTTRNYNFCIEQLEEKKNLNQNHRKFGTMIEDYFSSRFFTGENKFIICNFHVGDKDKVSALLASCEGLSEEELEEKIQNFCESQKQESKMPIPALLMYLNSLKDSITVDQMFQGILYNKIRDKIERQKLHPIVPNNDSFDWGMSSKINGRIISPKEKAKHNAQNNRSLYDSGIWIEISVLKNKEWAKHHYKISNTRFVEEFYYPSSNDENSLDQVFRTGRNGFNNPAKNNLSLEQVSNIKNAPKNRRRAIKRQMRVEAAHQQNVLPHVKWDDNYCITISKYGDKFVTFISKKFKSKKSKEYVVFLGFDQNQTASHTFAAVQICDSKDENVIPYCGLFVKPLECGHITSVQKVKDRSIDQLSYSGLPWKDFISWSQERKEFVSKWRMVEVKTRNGEKLDDLTVKINKLDENKHGLYAYNSKYFWYLKSIMRKKTKDELFEIRKELLTVIKTGRLCVLRLSSLNHSSFLMLKNAKSAISCYFNNLLKGVSNDQEKYEADPEMFELRREVEAKRQNKCMSKKNLISSQIVSKAIELRGNYGSVAIIGEDLSDYVPDKGKKSTQNANLLDWLSRGVANKVKQIANMHDNISFKDVSPQWTSHQDSFVDRNPNSALRVRFGSCDPEEMYEKDFESLIKFLKEDCGHYTNSMNDFLSHYGVSRKDMLEIKFSAFKILMKNILNKTGEKSLLYPKRGGRLYLATHKLGQCTRRTYNGVDFWECDADCVAAFNIALSGIRKYYGIKSEAVSPV